MDVVRETCEQVLTIDWKKNMEIKEYKRVNMMDTLRGIIIIGVVIYHTLFDLYDLFGFDLPWMESSPVNFIRDFGAGVLIFISGVSSHLSRNNIKRGIKTLICAMILSLVTYFFVPENFIFIGILHFLGFMMLMYGIFGKYINKLSSLGSAIIFFVIFLLVFRVEEGYIGISNVLEISLPDSFYDSTFDYLLGFGGGHYFSADYFPLIPWMFLFLSGTFVGNYVKCGKIPAFLYKDICRPITYIGRHTLIIYLVHQPLVYGTLLLVSHIMR